jgi:hypothetical protein
MSQRMGERTTISGHIQEPWYTPGGDDALRAFRNANTRVLRRLPNVDRWPYLHRSMFVRSRELPLGGGSASYRGTVIHFGGSFSSLHSDIEIWKTKFESVLRQMYWEHAALLVVTEVMGTHHYVWQPTSEAWDGMLAQNPTPISGWQVQTSLNPL